MSDEDSSSRPPQQVYRIPSTISVQCNLTGKKAANLDSSCVAFDSQGAVVDAVFFNNKKTDYVSLTTDDEDDESLIFHLSKVPSAVTYLMVSVTSYTGADFSNIGKARVGLINLATKESVGGFSLGNPGMHTATLLCIFSRAPGDDAWWDLREANIPCSGFTFFDVIPKMLELLALPKENHDAAVANLPDYSLEKRDPMWELVLSQVKFGIGWEWSSKEGGGADTDLDADMVMLSANGRVVETLLAKQRNKRCILREGGAQDDAANVIVAQHSGDVTPDTDPAKVAGDDEHITVDLMSVDPRVHSIFFIVSLNCAGSRPQQLSEVRRAYCRLLNKPSNTRHASYKELKRSPISTLSQGATLLVPYMLRRSAQQQQPNNKWELIEVTEFMSCRDTAAAMPFLRAYSVVGPASWQQWSFGAFTRFGVRVTIDAVRNLGPVQPDEFSCRCLVSVRDRLGSVNFHTEVKLQRDNAGVVKFSEGTGICVVNTLDVLNVCVFATDTEGHFSVPMAEFFPMTPHAMTFNGVNKIQGDATAAAASARARPTMDGETMLDKWIPLQGKTGVTGEVKVKLVRTSLEEVEHERKKAAAAIMQQQPLDNSIVPIFGDPKEDWDEKRRKSATCSCVVQ